MPAAGNARGNGGEIVSKDKVDPPDELWERVEARFGDAAQTKNGIYCAALWYACERYDAEHGGPPGDAHADED